MRILVIDDKQIHRDSAKETLGEHELTIVSSYNEGMKLLETKVDENKLKTLLVEMGITKPKKGSDAEWKAYSKKHQEAENLAVIPCKYDVVLTDMLMPMSEWTLASEVFNPNKQVPYGWVIALRAAQVGAKFVAMVTDTNHHRDPMSAAIDLISEHCYYSGNEKPLQINGAKVLFLHTPFTEIETECDDCHGTGKCKWCNGTGLRDDKPCNSCHKNHKSCTDCKGTGKIKKQTSEKDWGKVLQHLLKS